MGKYSEAEDRHAAEITYPDNVIDLESYRQQRKIAGRDANANQLRETEAEGVDAGDTSGEGDHHS